MSFMAPLASKVPVSCDDLITETTDFNRPAIAGMISFLFFSIVWRIGVSFETNLDHGGTAGEGFGAAFSTTVAQEFAVVSLRGAVDCSSPSEFPSFWFLSRRISLILAIHPLSLAECISWQLAHLRFNGVGHSSFLCSPPHLTHLGVLLQSFWVWPNAWHE